MNRPAPGQRFIVTALVVILAAVGCGVEDKGAFSAISDRLGWPKDEEAFALYIDSVFVPGLDHAEVHEQIDGIGDNRVCEQIMHVDGMKVEIMEIRTGTPALDEYDYLKWDFVFDSEGSLVRVALNSWW
jgi:hypothetical protein